MKKKIFIAAVLAVIIAFPLYGHSPMSFGFNLHVGYNSCNLGSFGEVYPQIYREGFGVDKDGTNISAVFIKGGDIKYFPIENFAIDFRVDLLVIENKDFLHDEILGEDTIKSNVIFNVAYFGLGPKYYFKIDSVPGFLPYVGINAGVFYHLGSYWEVTEKEGTAYYDPLYAGQKIDFTGMFFGGTAEVGVEWMFGNLLGISIGGGYRYAQSTAQYEKEGVFKKEALAIDTIDFSGIYVLGGTGFYF